jgi:hypothetical protein
MAFIPFELTGLRYAISHHWYRIEALLMSTENEQEHSPQVTMPPSSPPEDPELDYDNWLETEAVKKLNGQFTNRLFVQHLGDGLLRLNFGDVQDSSDPSYHTALVITAANAIQFAELIYRMGNAAHAVLAQSFTGAENGQGA